MNKLCALLFVSIFIFTHTSAQNTVKDLGDLLDRSGSISIDNITWGEEYSDYTISLKETGGHIKYIYSSYGYNAYDAQSSICGAKFIWKDIVSVKFDTVNKCAYLCTQKDGVTTMCESQEKETKTTCFYLPLNFSEDKINGQKNYDTAVGLIKEIIRNAGGKL